MEADSEPSGSGDSSGAVSSGSAGSSREGPSGSAGKKEEKTVLDEEFESEDESSEDEEYMEDRWGKLSHLMTKPTKWLGVAKESNFLHVDSKDWSDWADAQADQSLRWAHMPFCWFCHEAAQRMINTWRIGEEMFLPS